MSNNITVLPVVIYLVIKLTYIFKGRAFITYISEFEGLVLMYCAAPIVNLNLFKNIQSKGTLSFISAIVPLVIFMIYFIISRSRAYKLLIHNVAMKLFMDKFEDLLIKHNIQFAKEKYKLVLNNKVIVYFSGESIIIKNYKEIPLLNEMIKDFKYELKSMPTRKKNISIAFDILFLVMFSLPILISLFFIF
ncbi:hypothetical protein [Clostridium grantii]|uniref:Uncharacterized protein n=1 Tax=Clostridium grantii DSM 8605 TaxID=1121316 RepID=A0A1M5WUI3_9CLOT|nr:hypothetical protein [Clostridium grantii]SHH90643.1 hypothetical protein SAMN02745207_03095 [Clostridium grantii DSM 8605]